MLIYDIPISDNITFSFGQLDTGKWLVRICDHQVMRSVADLRYAHLLQIAHLYGLDNHQLQNAQNGARRRSYEITQETLTG